LGSLSGRLRRLEREAEEETIAILQEDGTVKMFPRSAGVDAYANCCDRMGGLPPVCYSLLTHLLTVYGILCVGNDGVEIRRWLECLPWSR
jgi:hypothetical protein